MNLQSPVLHPFETVGKMDPAHGMPCKGLISHFSVPIYVCISFCFTLIHCVDLHRGRILVFL